MIERPTGFVLLALPLLWAEGVALTAFPATAVPWVVTIAILWALVALGSTLRGSTFGQWGLLLFGATVLIAAVGYFASGPVGGELAAGVLLGVPWALIAFTARPGDSLGYRFVAYGAAVAWGLGLLATPSLVATGSAGAYGHGFTVGFFQVFADQSKVLGGLVAGAAQPNLPLHELFDPVYATLTAISLLGLLLTTVRPQTGRGVVLPLAVRAFRAADRATRLPLTYGFSPAQEAVYLERSAPQPPLTPWPPGLVPVLVGAAGAGAFLAAAELAPVWAVLSATVAVAVAVVVVVVVSEVPKLLYGSPGRPRHSSRVRFPPRGPEMLTAPSFPTKADGVSAPAPER